MALVYKSICMEIDDLIVKIMHLSEKLIQQKLEVEKAMNNGFFNVAKARYIMGRKCVSTLQLPTKNSNPFQPLATLCRTPYEGYWIFKVNRKEPSLVSSDEKIKQKNFEENTLLDIKELLEKDSKSIWKRKEFYLVDDNNYKDLNDELQDEVSTDSSESKDSLENFSDPIRLFGVLVPNTLRIAQKNFQETLDVIASCASIQSEIHTVLMRYCHLKNVKRIIESAAEERDIDLTEEKRYWSPSEKSSERSVVFSDPVPSEAITEWRENEKQAQPESVEEDTEVEVDSEEGRIYVSPEDAEYFKTSDENDESIHNSEVSQK